MDLAYMFYLKVTLNDNYSCCYWDIYTIFSNNTCFKYGYSSTEDNM